MVDRKGLIGWAACSALAIAGIARADDGQTSVVANDLSLTRPLQLQDQPAAAAPATPPAVTKPLMGLLETAGVGKGLEAANINVYGFVEGSYTYSASAPPHNVIFGNVSCPGNSPAPQKGDSKGKPNVVFGSTKRCPQLPVR